MGAVLEPPTSLVHLSFEMRLSSGSGQLHNERPAAQSAQQPARRSAGSRRARRGRQRAESDSSTKIAHGARHDREGGGREQTNTRRTAGRSPKGKTKRKKTEKRNRRDLEPKLAYVELIRG